MKKYLLPNHGSFFKANLHCHTTISDGRWTPERVKDEYKKRGYSIVAFTDHDLMICHPELCDEHFLALNGYEMEVGSQPGNKGFPTCHMCFVALKPEIDRQILWNRERFGYTWGNARELIHLAKFDQAEEDFERSFNHECISKMMSAGRKAGFFVTYNHPTWSLETYEHYVGYDGMHAMEIVNNGCKAMGYEEYNARVYDDMLMAGKRIFCISTDDNHNALEDSFGGFTMIKADELKYESIGSALERGDFYASEAPLIYDLYVEDGYVVVTSSPVAEVLLNSNRTYAQRVVAKDGELLTTAKLKLADDLVYFRLTLIDASGKHANTNAYFLDEILK